MICHDAAGGGVGGGGGLLVVGGDHGQPGALPALHAIRHVEHLAVTCLLQVVNGLERARLEALLGARLVLQRAAHLAQHHHLLVLGDRRKHLVHKAHVALGAKDAEEGKTRSADVGSQVPASYGLVQGDVNGAVRHGRRRLVGEPHVQQHRAPLPRGLLRADGARLGVHEVVVHGEPGLLLLEAAPEPGRDEEGADETDGGGPDGGVRQRVPHIGRQRRDLHQRDRHPQRRAAACAGSLPSRRDGMGGRQALRAAAEGAAGGGAPPRRLGREACGCRHDPPTTPKLQESVGRAGDW
mmetsp:Transcript_38739/g.99062  ORF Transcript_38739/g.99062 Transcript_38739/m.99062 type:complete len:296 (-) Transcript_38739:61-948(-)